MTFSNLNNFVNYIRQIKDEKRLKINEIARKAGLDEKYTYKLLNGEILSPERDYILSICMAMKLSTDQTQQALSLYGLPLLGWNDKRAAIIMDGINSGYDRYEINRMLEDSGFDVIKTAPDMKSSPVTDSGYSIIEELKYYTGEMYDDLGIDNEDIDKEIIFNENIKPLHCLEIKAKKVDAGEKNHCTIVEACVNDGEKNLYLYLKMADDVVFRACDRSYMGFEETGCDTEMYPITVYKEIKNVIHPDDKEYFVCFGLVWDVAHKMIEGIGLPKIEKE